MFSRELIIFAMLFTAVARAENVIRVGGGAAPINNIFRKIQAPFEKSKGVTLKLSEDGPDRALKALDDGALDIASAGLGEKDWIGLAEEKKMTLKNRDKMKFRVIGKDLVFVITHSGIGVKSLSKEQLKGLFTGKTKNWKEIGGADQPVVVVIGDKIPGTNKFFKKVILDESDYAKESLHGDWSAPDVLAKVKETKGAIALAPAGLDTTGVEKPATPEVGRPITAATMGIPTQTIDDLFRFIKDEGHNFIK